MANNKVTVLVKTHLRGSMMSFELATGVRKALSKIT